MVSSQRNNKQSIHLITLPSCTWFYILLLFRAHRRGHICRSGRQDPHWRLCQPTELGVPFHQNNSQFPGLEEVMIPGIDEFSHFVDFSMFHDHLDACGADTTNYWDNRNDRQVRPVDILFCQVRGRIQSVQETQPVIFSYIVGDKWMWLD